MMGKITRVHSEAMPQATQRHLQDLYENLVAPYIADTDTSSDFVPHGSLRFLPFHAFYDGEQYLIDEFEVSYAPSASVLKYCLEKEPLKEKSPLLVGVSDKNALLLEEEVTQLSRLFPGARVLLGEAATRAAFVEDSRHHRSCTSPPTRFFARITRCSPVSNCPTVGLPHSICFPWCVKPIS
jgi:CHAT domain-containing protein